MSTEIFNKPNIAKDRYSKDPEIYFEYDAIHDKILNNEFNTFSYLCLTTLEILKEIEKDNKLVFNIEKILFKEEDSYYEVFYKEYENDFISSFKIPKLNLYYIINREEILNILLQMFKSKKNKPIELKFKIFNEVLDKCLDNVFTNALADYLHYNKKGSVKYADYEDRNN